MSLCNTARVTSPRKIKKNFCLSLEVELSSCFSKSSSSVVVLLHGIGDGDSTASLASSSESEDGGVSSPPRKKQRVSASNMQSNGCAAHNGGTGDRQVQASTSQMNGACSATSNGELREDGEGTEPVKLMCQSDRDIVRLIGQHLRGLGLK